MIWVNNLLQLIRSYQILMADINSDNSREWAAQAYALLKKKQEEQKKELEKEEQKKELEKEEQNKYSAAFLDFFKDLLLLKYLY